MTAANWNSDSENFGWRWTDYHLKGCSDISPVLQRVCELRVFRFRTRRLNSAGSCQEIRGSSASLSTSPSRGWLRRVWGAGKVARLSEASGSDKIPAAARLGFRVD